MLRHSSHTHLRLASRLFFPITISAAFIHRQARPLPAHLCDEHPVATTIRIHHPPSPRAPDWIDP